MRNNTLTGFYSTSGYPECAPSLYSVFVVPRLIKHNNRGCLQSSHGYATVSLMDTVIVGPVRSVKNHKDEQRNTIERGSKSGFATVCSDWFIS